MANPNNQKSDTRVIDLTVSELFDIIDNRYSENNKTLLSKLANQTAQAMAYLNVNQCAKLTGYQADYIRQLVFKRKIPFYKMQNHSIRFSQKEIVDWMTTQKHIPTQVKAQQYIENNDIPNSIKFNH